MSWSYRVLRRADGSLALHEVRCDGSGRPTAAAAEPAVFRVDAEEGLERLIRDLERALDDARCRQVIDLRDFPER